MGDNSKLSTENLEKLLKELKKYNVVVTNQARLASMSANKAEKELVEMFLENPIGKYIDVSAWLRSPNPTLIYKGEDGEYLDSGEWKSCKMIRKTTKFGNDYIDIIIPEEQRQISVPRGHVRKVKV